MMDKRQATRRTHARSGLFGRARHLVLAATLGLTLGGGIFGGLAPIGPAAADDGCTAATEYGHTGQSQCFRVPAGITSVTFDVYGAQGGAGGGGYGSGGLGGRATATFAVTAGQRFFISVGGAGQAGGDMTGGNGGANGGGAGGGGASPGVSRRGGGGGGASDVRPIAWDGNYPGLDARLVVGGGGGGGGGEAVGGFDIAGGGGPGGGESGGAGRRNSNNLDFFTVSPGAGGTATEGGWAYDSNKFYGSDVLGTIQGVRGTFGKGGTAISYAGGGGGGGGGGYYGGGAGNSNALGSSGAGGGGGSGYVAPSASARTFAQGVQSGNGKVLIGYASTVTVTSSANPNKHDQNPTYTARVSPVPSGGGVTFAIDGYRLTCANNTALVNGVATCTSPAHLRATIGTHQITAQYSGYGSNRAATGALSQQVVARVDTTLALTTLGGQEATTIVGGQPLTFTATLYAVGAPAQQPLGKVTFYDDNGYLAGEAWPRATGDNTATATLTIRNASVMTHRYWARYEGTSTTAPSDSARVGLTVLPGYFDNDTVGEYDGAGWAYYPGRPYGDFQNDVHATPRAGDAFWYSFTGTGITYYGEKDKASGEFDIYLDGQYKGTASAWTDASNVPQQVLYRLTGLPYGQHTLRIVNKSNLWMHVDALAVTSR